ncbi:DNA-processing protein DprA [Wenjunlia tyrosinilytica]|uniref:Smf/DprA SLOG domain-containing protein n=1 Tax=Wenjunlia tyrosinilytica TaxID=1544741 RepID=A0A917ZTZ7_9ACTN|nr:DNA-processing protein DprA [Wenjunlia tyrosinilytica]GGO93726.1 hypothetical protein GCM10012280_46910 [Wenjunlia tyrosinilytica]
MTVSDQERHARAALTRIAEPADTAMGRLLRDHTPEEALRRLTTDADLPGISERKLDGYRTRLDGPAPQDDLAAIDSLGGRFVCPGDPEWPRQLDDLGDQRPYGLWVRGAPSLRLLALRSVAVVGARACTAYGAHVASGLCADLGELGWAVVSGAAYGVDAAAHRGSLSVGGATVAVVASGVDVPYPRGHAQLLRRIAEQGLLIAELPPGEHPTRSRFILRNRVIAALTPGTVVVEAEYRSGALITARRAAELGRFTMAVPGPVTSALSGGAHELLRGEAVLVTRAAEVVELCGSIGDLASERRGHMMARDLLPSRAARVLEAVPPGDGASPQAIAKAAGVVLDEALAALHELLPMGFVARRATRWRLVPSVANTRASPQAATTGPAERSDMTAPAERYGVRG